MSKIREWQGVRLSRVLACADPDGPPRPVVLPAAWDEDAAAALAALVPGAGPARLIEAAEGWIGPLADGAAASATGGADFPLAARLRALLRARRAAPTPGIWRGTAEEAPGFVLNLAAFRDAAGGFDREGLAEAVETVARALRVGAPGPRRAMVGIADLAGLLAALGLAYDSAGARAFAADLARLLRARADAGPQPPGCGVFAPGLADALLGVETGGIAPAFSALAPGGGLTRAACAFLAARGMSGDAALAALLGGESPFPAAGPAAHAAMHDVLAPHLQQLPPRPAILPRAGRAAARESLPARRRGYTQKAVIGGHKLYLRTGEYQDGRLGEISVGLNRETPAFRGLMDAFTTAVSLGLQHGVPLGAYAEALAGSRFGAAGAVEGDPAVAQASSPVDYILRHLAGAYLGRTDLPTPAAEPTPPETLLPLDLPRLRLVKK